MVKDTTTESIILEAARTVFLKKGMAGARMQEIADEAGINKALLHYYYRSKEKLFDRILEEAIGQIADGLNKALEEEQSVTLKLFALVEVYLNVLRDNRYLPLFVLNEMNLNPEKITALIERKIAKHIPGFLKQVREEVEQGLIAPIHPMHLLLNALSLIIFPVAAYPVLSKIGGAGELPVFEAFLDERKPGIKQFITHALRP